MKKPFGKRALLAVVMVPLAIALLTTDARLHSEEKKADKNPAVKKKLRAKPRGRLPAFYRNVVTPEQREKVYAIQAKYEPQIEKLRAALRSLRDNRDAEIAVLLTAEQKEKVAKLREEARAERLRKRALADKQTKNKAAAATTSATTKEKTAGN